MLVTHDADVARHASRLVRFRDGRVIEDAERTCARVQRLPPGSAELLQEAHSLKGTAGLFGLRWVSAAADELQAAARESRDTSAAVARLAAAVAATRDELLSSGLASGPAPGERTRRLEEEAPHDLAEQTPAAPG